MKHGCSAHYLRRVKLVVDLYRSKKLPGYSDAYVYREFINPVYPMSISTFYEYLSVPVEKLMKLKNENLHD